MSYRLLVASGRDIWLHVGGASHVVDRDPHWWAHGTHVTRIHHHMVTVHILARVQIWCDGGVTADAALGRAVSPLAVDTGNVVDAVSALVLAYGVEPDEVLLGV